MKEALGAVPVKVGDAAAVMWVEGNTITNRMGCSKLRRFNTSLDFSPRSFACSRFGPTKILPVLISTPLQQSGAPDG